MVYSIVLSLTLYCDPYEMLWMFIGIVNLYKLLCMRKLSV